MLETRDTRHPLYAKVSAIYLSLPDTTMEMKWGSPHFCVGGKLFGGFGVAKDGKPSMSVKLELDHADARVADDPRFSRAPYVGNKGWVRLDLDAAFSLEELRALVGESHRLIAPKAKRAAAKKAPAKKAPAKKTPAKKTPAKKAPAKKAPAKKSRARSGAA